MRTRVTVLLIVAAVLLPLAMVLGSVSPFADGAWDQVLYRPFLYATKRSFTLLLWLSLFGSLLGVLMGSVAAAWKFQLKLPALMLLCVPLILPSFVTAIGVQSLQPFFSFTASKWLDGYWGSFWSGLAIVLPLSTLGCFVAGLTVSQSEREVVRLSQGNLLWQMICRIYPVALASATFGALLFLSDSGSGQIMGYHGISGDILVSFSAKNDFHSAAMKSLALILLFLPIALVMVMLARRQCSFDLLQLKQSHADLDEPVWWRSILLSSAYTFLCTLPVLAIFIGLVRPLRTMSSQRYIDQAFELFWDSIGTTLFYGGGAALVALVLAGVLNRIVPKKWRGVSLFVSVLLIAIPSCISALGMVKLGTGMPASMDWLFRSELVVALGLGLRYVPLAYLLIVVTGRVLPKSSVEAAQIYQVPAWQKFFSILLPTHLEKWLSCFILIALFTLADVSSMTLLQPPGGASFGSHLFAVMDAASEKTVAGLCVVYLTVPLTLATLLALYKLIRIR